MRSASLRKAEPDSQADAMRCSNTMGPVNPGRHYQVPPLSRIALQELLRLVEEKRCFLLHAPLQTGEATVLGAPLDD